MAYKVGVGEYQYELVANWPDTEIPGVAADVACDSEDRVYVAARGPGPGGEVPTITPGKGSLLIFSRDGRLLESREDIFSAPHGLWIGPEDEMLHADTGTHTVTQYALSGEVKLTLGVAGRAGAPGSPFNMPTHAVRSRSGHIVVSDGYGQNRMHRFSSEGALETSWGSGDPVFLQQFKGETVTGTPGTGPGEFNLPHDAVVDGQNRVYVMDRTNNRCQVFDLDGNYLAEWADVLGPNNGVIDRQGVMHIVGRQGVELRSLEGELLGRWGEKGEGPGRFTHSPHGVWIDSHDDIYVAEVGGFNRLQKFARV